MPTASGPAAASGPHPAHTHPRWGLSALAGGRRPEELTAGKCQHPASTCSPDSAAEVLRKHGIPLPTNDCHLRQRFGRDHRRFWLSLIGLAPSAYAHRAARTKPAEQSTSATTS